MIVVSKIVARGRKSLAEFGRVTHMKGNDVVKVLVYLKPM